ncbi:hypothetical protein F9288_14920 [Sphingomonas sp. CL5.1]|uniref:DUF6628 family protein n=1 Tax=Sphingomonas sp. CL5.1 TaxID=2653203 RepID=UPI00158416EF|nr:DUF6628 family protein [Sphingomonas sp. CL5.1]QKS00770.1 hypothetical protein F9288_14920 [Sphingomonas sp. CL5.1]
MTLPAATTAATALPYPLPSCPNARVLLFAIRRMGAHGLADARAAHAMFTLFREGFRRPLTLLRALMADLAGNAALPIAIAPCCCARMTVAESALLTTIARVETAPETAALLLGDLLGIRRPDGVLASIAAVSAAFADEGRPIFR